MTLHKDGYERHSYISQGISHEAFQDAAVRQTSLPENAELYWYLHAHAHTFGKISCNDRCQVVHNGKAENVTRLEAEDAFHDA